MKLHALLCVAMAFAAAAAAADTEPALLRGFDFAVAGQPSAQPAQGASAPQGQAHAGGSSPPPADKNGGAHAAVAAKPQEAPRHDARAPAPSASAARADKGRGDPKVPTKTRKDADEDDEDDGEDDSERERRYMARIKADRAAGRMPGRMKMVVPPRTVHTPLFELDSVVELQWEYDKNVVEVPERLTISVQLPKDPHADGGAKPVVYDVAVNISGKQTRFFWDTKNDIPEGVGMREGSGYTMYFYDADIGFRMSDVVPAGYLIKYAMPFAFYSSRYEHTNDGVPRNYNPNAAARPVPALLRTAALLLLAVAAAVS